MTAHRKVSRVGLALAAGLGVALARCVLAEPPQSAPPATATPPVSPPRSPAAATVPYVKGVIGGARSQRGEMYYARRFGVDQMHVRSTASGSSLEFRYRVVDPNKAAVLNDKHATPVMIDQKTGTRLQVPMMEKIGSLRQMATPEQGREYWMVFTNPGRLVRPGERVDIVIGSFRVSSLTVE